MTAFTTPIPTFAGAESVAKGNLTRSGGLGAGRNGRGAVVGYPTSIAGDVGSARAA